ncbi:MAG: tetratricopeptide repeat protein [Planctomycetes bacterium]|nr:tetratricopeptide repeat protein [Planctomycetota bacterium]
MDAPALAPQARRAHLLWSVLLCALLVGLCYANSLRVPFLLDDPLPEKRLEFGTRTLVWASFALNRALSGAATWSYHAFNLLAHFLCGLALLGVVRRATALVAPALAAASRARLALAVTALWLCHPLQTSAVTYISQRAETLAVLFYLGTLYGHLRSLDSPTPRRWQLYALASLALGFASKEIIATAPALMLLAECVLVPGAARDNLRRRWRFHALVAAFSLVLFLIFIAPPLFAASKSSGFGFRAGATSLAYLRSQPGVLLHYLRLVLWPHPLVFDYAWPVARELGAWLPQTLLILALLAATLVGLLRRSWPGFALAAFFLVLAPTSSFVPIKDLAFEHRMVLPLAALLVPLCAGVAHAGRRWAPRLPCLPGLLAAAATVALAAATVQRNHEYRTAIELWRTVVARAPHNPRAYNNLAAALLDAERSVEAEALLKTALELDPGSSFVQRNLAAIAAERGDLEGALRYLERALELGESAQAHCDAARLLLLLERRAEAEQHVLRALELEPGHAQAQELKRSRFRR